MISTFHNTRENPTVNEKILPSCIADYNKFMNGVDKFDQILSFEKKNKKIDSKIYPSFIPKVITQLLYSFQ